MDQTANRITRMGTEPIPRLLFEFSIPVIVGMLVQALYGVINRAFIGSSAEAATLGMAAITIGMPIAMVSMAIAMLVGFGGAVVVSSFLGKKDLPSAEKTLTNALVVSVVIGAVVTALGLAFLDPILVALGANASVMPYARSYNSIILAATIPMTLGFGLNNFIRAEGNPRHAMFILILSALINVFLDFLLIVVLRLGIVGAAIGTLAAQTFTAVLVIAYFASGKSHLHFRLKFLAPDLAIISKVLTIGVSVFSMQMGVGLSQFVINRQLSVYGGEVALASWGVITTLSIFFFNFIYGLNGGSQPLISYNNGSGNHDRVRKVVATAVVVATVFLSICWAMIMVFSGQIVGVFSGEDRALREMTSVGLRIASALIPFVGIQIIAAGYFNSVGKPMIAMTLALLRQVIILIPLVFVLPGFLGLDGVFWATPVADGLAAVVTVVTFLREFSHTRT